MNIWDILGIEPTKNTSDIKKSYAAKLKIFHPEKDPEGYQKLREAYDMAIKFAKSNKDIEVNNSFESQASSESIKDKHISEENEIEPEINPEIEPINDSNTKIPSRIVHKNFHVNQQTSTQQQIHELMDKLKELYGNFFSRIEVENWKVLLNSDIVWNIKSKTSLEQHILDFLSSHHYLPQDVFELFDSYFHWSGKELNSRHKSIVEDILSLKPLDFTWFKNNKAKYSESINFDEYLMYREKAQKALLRYNMEDTIKYIKLAKGHITDDPDLLHIEREYFVALNKKNSEYTNLKNKSNEVQQKSDNHEKSKNSNPNSKFKRNVTVIIIILISLLRILRIVMPLFESNQKTTTPEISQIDYNPNAEVPHLEPENSIKFYDSKPIRFTFDEIIPTDLFVTFYMDDRHNINSITYSMVQTAPEDVNVVFNGRIYIGSKSNDSSVVVSDLTYPFEKNDDNSITIYGTSEIFFYSEMRDALDQELELHYPEEKITFITGDPLFILAKAEYVKAEE